MKKWVIFAVVAVISLAADQGTKIWARSTLRPLAERPVEGRHGITVIEGFFDLTFAENTGAAFGLLRDTRWARPVLAAVGLLALGFIVSYLRKLEGPARWLATALGLVAGGAIGNIIDRVAFGKVTDFVVWHYHDLRWPTFNIADAALVAGVIMLVIGARGGEKRAASGVASKR